MAPARLLAAGCALGLAACAPSAAPRPNVLLVVVDTLAAEHMAPYGYDRVTTPELDELARRGVLFRNAYSTAPWTLPAHASMFTGLAPGVHGATQEHLALHEGHETLAETLRDAGYRTFAAVANPVLNTKTGLDQGFEIYRTVYTPEERERLGAGTLHPVNEAFRSFVDELAADEGFFAFVNYIEPHARYQPPDELALQFLRDDAQLGAARDVDGSWARHYLGENALDERDFELLTALYDAELARASQLVGELRGVLEERGLDASTLMVVTSDHGENIGEHGHVDHVFSLHDSVLRVPLFVVGPGVPAGRIELAPVSTLDVHATVLAAVGEPSAGGFDLFADKDPERVLTAEYHYPLQVLSVLRAKGYEGELDRLDPFRRRLRSVRRGSWKLVVGSDGSVELFDVARDPGERTDLTAAEPGVVDELKQALFDHLAEERAFLARPEAPPPQSFDGVDDATLEELRALGYVGEAPR